MKNFLSSLFCGKKINTDRQYEIDFLRGFTFLILVICHVGFFLTNNQTMFYVADLAGSEAGAPVFMILLGVSVIYSRHQNAKSLLKRGLIFFIGSYLLNLTRSFPYWITGELDYFACVPGFFVIDIYQFVGLTFLLFALFKALKMPSWGVFCVAVGFLITGQILMALPTSLQFPEEAKYFLNLFLPIDSDWCCFNLLTWFIYPSFGLVFGELLIRCKNKGKFSLILLLLGSIGVIILYLNIGLRFPNYSEYYFGGNFYLMGVGNTIVTLLMFCFLFAIWHYIGKIIPNLLNKFLTFMSKNISFLYVASWVEISALIHIMAYYKIEFPIIALIGIMLVVLISCCLLALPYKKFSNCLKQHRVAK